MMPSWWPKEELEALSEVANALFLKGDLAQGDRRARHVLPKVLHGSRIGCVKLDVAFENEA
jgi:hypothetical protein